jgi:hypothetical protein
MATMVSLKPRFTVDSGSFRTCVVHLRLDSTSAALQRLLTA